MSSLCALPNECLLLVYGQLADFDDALSLSRSWRLARELFRKRLRSILRAIVLASDTYKYDLRLCRLAEANRTLLWTDSALPRCLAGGPSDLTDEHVQSIVRRWRQACLLHDLYINPSIQAEYRQQGPQCVHHYCHHHRLSPTGLSPYASAKDDAPVPSHRPPPRGLDIRALESQRKRRFYTALTAYWTAVEARQLAAVSASAPTACPPSDLELVDRLWSGCEDRSLLESMDVLEVNDFVYDFLLGRLLPMLVRHCRWLDPDMFRSGPAWESLLRFSRLRLRPSAIAEIIVHGPEAVGADHLFAELSSASDETARLLADWRYPARLLEQALETALRRQGIFPDGHDLATIWTCYRNHWAHQVRGVLFTKALSSDDVIRDIQHYAVQAACLTRHPHFVHLSRTDRPSRAPAGDCI